MKVGEGTEGFDAANMERDFFLTLMRIDCLHAYVLRNVIGGMVYLGMVYKMVWICFTDRKVFGTSMYLELRGRF